MWKSLIVILFISILTQLGCATNKYIEFTKNTDAVTIVEKFFESENSSFVWEAYHLVSIGDNFVEGSYTGGINYVSTVKVDPGETTCVIAITFNKGYMTGPFQAQATVSANLEPGKSYIINGKINSGNVDVWLEDSQTHQISSKIISTPWHKIVTQSSTLIPIIMPMPR